MIEDLKERYWDFYRTVIGFWESVKRRIFWFSKTGNSVDFDAHTIYEMLYYKLDRIYRCCLEDKHLVWNGNEKTNLMRKLLEAKGLAKKLDQDDYTFRAFEEADQKFIYISWFEKSDIMDDGEHTYRHKSTYKKSPKRAEMYRKGRDKIYLKQREIDRKRLFYLLEKYITHWWC